MGFSLKKIGKSIKKVVKKIGKVTGISKVVKEVGRGVKKVVTTFGKFMDKIGVVGQVAMMFILPGIGGALMKGFSAMAGWGANLAASAGTGIMGSLQAGVGHMAQFVGKAVTTAGNVFANVSKGVTDTLGNFAQTLGNKMGITNAGASNFFGSGGADSAWSRSFGESSRFQNLTMDPTKAGKLAKAASEIAEEATINGVTLPEAGVTDPITGQKTAITQEQIKKEALKQLASDELVAEAIAERAAEQAALANAKAVSTDSLLSGPLQATDKITGEAIEMSAVSQGSQAEALAKLGTEPTFMDKVKSLPSDLLKEAKKLPDKALEYAKETPERLMKQAIEAPEAAMKRYVSTVAQEKALETVHGEGFREIPAPQYTTIRVPAIEMPYASTQVQAPEVDYRNFAQDISTNPNPYGNTAYQYQVGYEQYRQSLA